MWVVIGAISVQIVSKCSWCRIQVLNVFTRAMPRKDLPVCRCSVCRGWYDACSCTWRALRIEATRRNTVRAVLQTLLSELHVYEMRNERCARGRGRTIVCRLQKTIRKEAERCSIGSQINSGGSRTPRRRDAKRNSPDSFAIVLFALRASETDAIHRSSDRIPLLQHLPLRCSA
jgi:hypothetical protein